MRAGAAKNLVQRLRSDQGSATVEFVGLSVVLIIPLIYLVIFLSLVQSATFAADSTARQISRVYSIQSDPAKRQVQMEKILENTARDYQVEIDESALTISCSTSACPAAGAHLNVEVKIGVDLPGIGSIGLGEKIVEVKSHHSLVVDESIGMPK